MTNVTSRIGSITRAEALVLLPILIRSSVLLLFEEGFAFRFCSYCERLEVTNVTSGLGCITRAEALVLHPNPIVIIAYAGGGNR